MTIQKFFTYGWITIIVGAAILEVAALVLNKKVPSKGLTLSEHVWHVRANHTGWFSLCMFFLAWMLWHFIKEGAHIKVAAISLAGFFITGCTGFNHQRRYEQMAREVAFYDRVRATAPTQIRNEIPELENSLFPDLGIPVNQPSKPLTFSQDADSLSATAD